MVALAVVREQPQRELMLVVPQLKLTLTVLPVTASLAELGRTPRAAITPPVAVAVLGQ